MLGERSVVGDHLILGGGGGGYSERSQCKVEISEAARWVEVSRETQKDTSAR